MDMVEFTPIEQVNLRPARILNLSRLWMVNCLDWGEPKGEDGIQAMEAWQSYMKRSETFESEWIRYDIITSNAEDLLETLETAIEALESRQLGWLDFRTDQPSQEVVSVFARVDLGKFLP